MLAVVNRIPSRSYLLATFTVAVCAVAMLTTVTTSAQAAGASCKTVSCENRDDYDKPIPGDYKHMYTCARIKSGSSLRMYSIAGKYMDLDAKVLAMGLSGCQPGELRLQGISGVPHPKLGTLLYVQEKNGRTEGGAAYSQSGLISSNQIYGGYDDGCARCAQGHPDAFTGSNGNPLGLGIAPKPIKGMNHTDATGKVIRNTFASYGIQGHGYGTAHVPLLYNLPNVPGGGIVRGHLMAGDVFYPAKVGRYPLDAYRIHRNCPKALAPGTKKVRCLAQDHIGKVEFAYGYTYAANGTSKIYGWIVTRHKRDGGDWVNHTSICTGSNACTASASVYGEMFPAGDVTSVPASSATEDPSIDDEDDESEYDDSIYDGTNTGSWSYQNRVGRIDQCGATWIKEGALNATWTQMSDCGTTSSLNLGISRIMMRDTCGDVLGKDGRLDSPLVDLYAYCEPKKVAISGSRIVVMTKCGAVFAKEGGMSAGWTQLAACGTTTDIAAAGNRIGRVNQCGGTYVKEGALTAGWWFVEGYPDGCGVTKRVLLAGTRLGVVNSCGGSDTALNVKQGALSAGWVGVVPCGYSPKGYAMSSDRVGFITNCNLMQVKVGQNLSASWNYPVGTSCPGDVQVLGLGDDRLTYMNTCGAVISKVTGDINAAWHDSWLAGCGTTTALAIDCPDSSCVSASEVIDTTITGTPPSPSVNAQLSFNFSIDQASTAECSVDGGAWTSCGSPYSLSSAGMSNGTHTLAVRGADEFHGNVDMSPASASFVVDNTDTTPPVVTISSPAANTTMNMSSVAVSFSANEYATFRCKTDSDPWQQCASPYNTFGLVDGAHTVAAEATDGSGNVTTLVRSFNVLSTVPPPEAMVMTVRSDQGSGWVMHNGQMFSLGNWGWNSGCMSGFVQVGEVFDSNGFRLCVRSDLANRHFYIGNVVNNAGPYYQVQNGAVTYLGSSSWNHCPARTHMLGRVFNENGFWLCVDDTDNSGPEALISRVRSNSGNSELIVGGEVYEAGDFSWSSTCPQGMTADGELFDQNGFRLCVRNDLMNRHFYLGNVVNNGGGEYDIYQGGVNGIGVASWGYCPSGSTENGELFDPNGFILCSTPGDTTQPVITVSSPAANAMVTTSAVGVSFTANEPATFRCKIDSGAFATCASPYSTSPLANGAHNLTIEATDPSGNVGTRVVSFTVNAPLAAPTNIMASSISKTTVQLSWNASLGGSGLNEYDIYLNGSYFDYVWGNPPASGRTLSSLTCGTNYAVKIVALDSTTWAQSSTVNFSTLPCNAVTPTATITSPTSNQTLNNANVSVAFTTTGSPTSVTCKLDTGTPANCTSPALFTSLVDGSHTVAVTANNAVGTSSAVVSFKVDTTAPDTAFTDGLGDGDTISTATATYRFTSDEPGMTFQCKIDSGTYASCTSPFTTPSLANGTHIVYVRALDAVGNADASPAQRTVIVSVASGGSTAPTGGGSTAPTGGALTAPTNVAASSITKTTAQLSWTASTGGSGLYEYDIFRNGSYFDYVYGSPPATTRALTGLTCGTTYSFYVVALDSSTWAQSSTMSLTTAGC